MSAVVVVGVDQVVHALEYPGDPHHDEQLRVQNLPHHGGGLVTSHDAGWSVELETDVAEDDAKIYNHGEGPNLSVPYDLCVCVPISHLLIMGLSLFSILSE